MHPTEAVRLVALVRITVPSQKMADYDDVAGGGSEEAWYAALGDLRFEDCALAVTQLGVRRRPDSPYIDQASVRAEVAAIRSRRIMEAPPMPIPASFDPDDTTAYRALVAEYQRRAADGEFIPPPPELPNRSVLKAIKGVFPSPPKVRRQAS